ncbi:unnamed protein product [Prorocentrum cordatum]|uniref:Uncharacterized protein n=1 Tax=Prorocentrum cordatum TaxID=2364126 RepID=A0ABN9SMY3_9DINO|nr:unnamed protein product [Polarella glacialis]
MKGSPLPGLKTSKRSGEDRWYSGVLDACRDGVLQTTDCSFLRRIPTSESGSLLTAERAPSFENAAVCGMSLRATDNRGVDFNSFTICKGVQCTARAHTLQEKSISRVRAGADAELVLSHSPQVLFEEVVGQTIPTYPGYPEHGVPDEPVKREFTRQTLQKRRGDWSDLGLRNSTWECGLCLELLSGDIFANPQARQQRSVTPPPPATAALRAPAHAGRAARHAARRAAAAAPCGGGRRGGGSAASGPGGAEGEAAGGRAAAAAAAAARAAAGERWGRAGGSEQAERARGRPTSPSRPSPGSGAQSGRKLPELLLRRPAARAPRGAARLPGDAPARDRPHRGSNTAKLLLRWGAEPAVVRGPAFEREVACSCGGRSVETEQVAE